jgi:TRAP-type C4-dicarboxylate transport system substrate-binding protein
MVVVEVPAVEPKTSIQHSTYAAGGESCQMVVVEAPAAEPKTSIQHSTRVVMAESADEITQGRYEVNLTCTGHLSNSQIDCSIYNNTADMDIE